MITSDLIIKYTNALYTTPATYAPRYDEFRDMFSSGQIYSKEWLTKTLRGLVDNDPSMLIVGAWYGSLMLMLSSMFQNSKITALDIDPRCEQFIKNIIYNMPNLSCTTNDMYRHSYDADVIINTSCEHIPDVGQWLSLIPDGKVVVLQSNNYTTGNGHVNCVNSQEEFIKQTNLKEVRHVGELVMPMYTRYMIIGTK